MVEAVRLGRRSVDLDRHRLDAVVDDAGDGCRGRRVVAVMADEDPIIAMLDAAQGRPQHRRYDGRLVPGGHQNGDEAGFRRSLQLTGEGAGVAAVDRGRPPHPPPEIDEIDEQIVGGEDHEADRREQSELGGNARKDFDRVHQRGAAGSNDLGIARSMQPPGSNSFNRARAASHNGG